jgi:oligopeptide transport system ATP-binding protein
VGRLKRQRSVRIICLSRGKYKAFEWRKPLGYTWAGIRYNGAMSQHREKEVLLSVRELRYHSPVRHGFLRRQVGTVPVLDGISFDIHEGETVGLVGESGSGKSAAGRAILQLVRPTGGTVHFKGHELTRMSERQLRGLRREMQMIFQDPYAALSPRLTAGAIVGEPLNVHGLGDSAWRQERVHELLRLVGLNPYLARRHAHELSGGQRLRVGLARALATEPSFLVVDEPTSALDRSIRSQVVELLAGLREQRGLTYLLLTRDLSLARLLCDRIAVVEHGRISGWEPVKPS